MALSQDGKILGLRVKTTANLGAYLSTFAPAVPTFLYGTLLNGVYEIGAIHCEVTGVFTNTTPVDAYRGAGRPEACYVLERMVRRWRRRPSRWTPAEVRRKNFIPKFSERLPDPGGVLVRQRRLRPAARQAAPDARLQEVPGRAGGRAEAGPATSAIGFSTYIEACSHRALQGGRARSAPRRASGSRGKVRVHPTGKVTVFTGSHSHGQGHETTFAQLVADELGIPMERRRDRPRRHRRRSRSAWAPTAAARPRWAAPPSSCRVDKIKEKGKKIAAHLLEASPKPTSSTPAGKFEVKGAPGKAMPFGAGRADGLRAAQLPGGARAGPRGDELLRPVELLLPVRGPRLRGRGRAPRPAR